MAGLADLLAIQSLGVSNFLYSLKLAPPPSLSLVIIHQLFLHAATVTHEHLHYVNVIPILSQCSPRKAEDMHQRALSCYTRASALLQSQQGHADAAAEDE
jgi:hypothetical protein